MTLIEALGLLATVVGLILTALFLCVGWSLPFQVAFGTVVLLVTLGGLSLIVDGFLGASSSFVTRTVKRHLRMFALGMALGSILVLGIAFRWTYLELGLDRVASLRWSDLSIFVGLSMTAWLVVAPSSGVILASIYGLLTANHGKER